jgi:hypothetical protein
MHVHAELEGEPAGVLETNELMDKFNLALMLSPLVAISSAPYFFGIHRACNMRAASYFYQLYADFPLNGQLPPVMRSSAEVWDYSSRSLRQWAGEGWRIGYPFSQLNQLLANKGANWNPVRWNRRWNTIEMRFFDSDFQHLEEGKFALAMLALRRLSLDQEALTCQILPSAALELQIDQCFDVVAGKVMILDSANLSTLFHRATYQGLRDPLVVDYLSRLVSFAKRGACGQELGWLAIIETILSGAPSTSETILDITAEAAQISDAEGRKIVDWALKESRLIHPSLLRDPDSHTSTAAKR